jgi:hypothetical protein
MPTDFYKKLPVEPDEDYEEPVRHAPSKKTSWSNADLTPAAQRARRGIVDEPDPNERFRQGYADDVDASTLPPVETGPSVDELIEAAKAELRHADATSKMLGFDKANAATAQAAARYQESQRDPMGYLDEPNLGDDQATAQLKGFGRGAMEGVPTAAAIAALAATLGIGAEVAPVVAPYVSAAATKLGQPGPIGAALGGYEGYKHGGIPGAIEGGLTGYTIGSGVGALGRMGKALAGIEGGAAGKVAGAAGKAAAAEAPAAEAAAVKAAPKMFRSTEAGAYEAERLYTDAINKGYSESMARKLAGMPNRDMVFNASKGSAFPSNVKFPGKTPEDILERGFSTAVENPQVVTPRVPSSGPISGVRQVPDDVLEILSQRGPGTGPNAIERRAALRGNGIDPKHLGNPLRTQDKITELERALDALMRQRNFIPRGR